MYDPVQAFKDWADLKSREMFISPVDAQQPPEWWHPDRGQVNPMPPARSKTLAGDAHPPLSTLDGNIHEDLIRTRYIEPAMVAAKARLDENRKRLNEDRQKWWDENA